jgi:hypothetical protein
MGVLIFEGMKVGVLEGDFTISVDEEGKTDANLVLSTSYNVLPLWLRIAHENIILSHKASKDIAEKWNENVEDQKALLLAELTPSMQVFVACGTALDALYEQLRPFAKISSEDIKAWRENKTSRAAQIAEIVRRVYKLDNEVFKAFKKNIKSIIEFRDQAVHPTHEIKRTCTRSDVPVGVDWRFSAYRYHNSAICYRRTMEMFIRLYEKRASEPKVNENMQNIFKALNELGLVSENG